VVAEARLVPDMLAPHRGYVLTDGLNLPTGSPTEVFNAMMQATLDYGPFA
jgi:hypothetical protein